MIKVHYILGEVEEADALLNASGGSRLLEASVQKELFGEKVPKVEEVKLEQKEKLEK